MSSERRGARRGASEEQRRERAERVSRVAEYLIRHPAASNRELGEVHGVSHVTAMKDRAAVTDLWRERMAEAGKTVIETELAGINRQLVELWAAWDRSQQAAETIQTETDSGPAEDAPGPAPSQAKTRRTTASRIPEVRYQELIARLQERRTKLLGGDPGERLAVDATHRWTDTPDKPGIAEWEPFALRHLSRTRSVRAGADPEDAA